MPSPPTISELPELPVFPSGRGAPDQPAVFFPKILAFLEALRTWRTETNALAAYFQGLSSGSALALAIDTVGDAAYSLGADGWRHKRFTSASAVTLTVGTTHALTPGERTRFTQVGAGLVTMVGDGITLNSRDDALTSAGQFAVWELECVTVDEFDVVGDVTT